MKAMILAAGFGTRLKPLTNNLPKALIEYGGKPMIVNTIEYLLSFGIDSIVINTHHHFEKMSEFFDNFDIGCDINLSIEDKILGTGGGIINAQNFFEGEDFFIVMNTDVLTDFNLSRVINFHKENSPLATLVVQDRHTKRKLEFDTDMSLLQRATGGSKPENCFAFNGIHIISVEIFSKGYGVKFSDIIDIYLDAITKGSVVKGFDAGKSKFKDLGKIEDFKS